MTDTTLTKEKLFAYLIVDDIHLDEELKKKALEGNGDSFGKIGDTYYDKGDYTKALDWFRLGAGKDDAYAQFRLGRMYEHGRGVCVNYNLAMEFYLKAHNNGNITATNNIGYLYHSGKGVTRDHKTALKWYLESANKGNKCGQFNIGVCYELGLGVKKDIQYALEWYEKSELQEHVAATDSIKRLNKQGYYIDERQRKYLQMEKDMKEQKTKLEEQKRTIELLESILKLAEQNELKAAEKDNEIKLLKQENQLLKLKYYLDSKEQMNLNSQSLQGLETAIFKSVSGSISKSIAEWVKSNNTDNLKFKEDDHPKNDFCYDK